MNGNEIVKILRKIVEIYGKEIFNRRKQLIGMLFDEHTFDWQIYHLENALRTGELSYVIEKLPGEPERYLSLQAAERIHNKTRNNGEEIVSWILEAFGHKGITTPTSQPVSQETPVSPPSTKKLRNQYCRKKYSPERTLKI